MNQLSSITPLEIILIGFVAVGVFLFFRACWRNIKRSRQHLSLALLTLMMVLTAQTAWATTTSTINVGGTDYTLFTGFTATDGTAVDNVFVYGNMVDGDLSSSFHAFTSPAYVEFNSDDPIIPKGYIFNTYDASNWKPTGWVLKAKANTADEWTTLSSKSGQSLASGQELQYACDNNGNNAYKYFRFEVSNSNNNIWLTEIRLYGNMSYTHIAVKAATCTETGIKQECWRRTDGKYFTDEMGTTELAESDVIAPMISHTAVHHEATSTNIEYWQCSVCGKYFSDSGCTTEITEAETHSTVFGALSGGCYTLTSQTYTLTDDINTAGYIYVPEGVTATIDLNGHTIDRGLTSAVANGYVIKVAGTLTLTDSSTGGTVKGGMHDEYTSCVYVPDGGTFTLAGGTLIGNTSNEGNRAVYVAFSAHFIMTGGKITGDVCGINASGHLTISGGEISGNSQRGIYPGSYSISVSGNPRITGNGDVNVNLYYNDAARLTVTGALTEGASIGITPHGTPTANAPVTVTSGYGTYNTASPDTYFTLDNNSFVLGWNEDRTEVAVGTELYTVGFDMNGHGSAIDAVSVLSGCKVLEPTAPTADGWYFVGWFTDADCTAGNEYDFDNAVTSNMTLHAKWTQTAIHSIILPENMVIVSADQEAVGGKYPVGTNIRFKVKSADYVVDGDVSDGTNALTADGDGIYTVTMGDADITIIATIKKAAEPNVTLSGSDNYTANDDDVLTGSTSGTLTIPDGAKVTLSDVTISGGIVCSGTATITLVGTNSVSVSAYNKAGIQIGGSGKTLTIKGNGSLNATGGSAAAGIGLGRTWDDNATGGSVVIEGGNITASGGNGIGAGTVGNSKTATIGDIVIKGGTVNARLGKGEIVGVATANIGAIIIYDTIEKVDASAITESVTYMHVDGNTETDVTASASTYFTITEDGDRRVIVPKDNTDYNITIADGIEHGTLTGAATAKYMEKVTITATPDFGYRLSRLVVKDAQNNDVESTGNSFFMPKSNVTVSAVFEQGTHGTTEFEWLYQTGPEPEDIVLETIYDGVTTVNIQNREMSYKIRKYEGNTYYRFLLDNNTHDANIPYAGGTGEFYESGNPTNFVVPYDGETGYYDITMTDTGNGKWSVSILKTVAVMDAVPDQTYSGSAITPEPLVIAGSLSLTKGTDYVYSYTNNTDAGTAKVIATFQGDYASLGYVEKEFTILPSTVIVNVTGNGTVTYNDKSAASGETFGVVADKGTNVTLTLAPESGYAVRSVAYGYTNNSGTTAIGLKLPINGSAATLTVPNDLKDGTYVNLTVTFVSALAGGADEASAVALTGNTVTDLAGGWYKVDSDITFDHTLNLLGDTHLIIADGKTMTVNTASNRGIYSDYTLFVSGEGALNVTTTSSGIAVCVGNYVQTGATVTASGYIGIRCKDDFLGFDFDNDFTFSGGQLTATGSGGGGIDADNDITLSCTNATDFIQASSYTAHGAVKIADGKALTDGTEACNGMNGYSGTLTYEQRTAIGGKRLRRAVITSYVDATGTLHENVIAIPLSETEGVSYLTTYLQGETVPVVFKRTFKAGQPSTLCLPFSFVPDQTTQGKVYEFGGVNDQWRVQMNNIQMSDATAATVANQPYGFIPVIPDGKKKGDEVELTFSGIVNVANAAADHTQVGNWDMHGTYERVDWSSGYWYGYNAANGVFSHCVSGAYFPTFRCYLVFTPPSATRGNLSLGTTVPDQMGVDFNDSANALATGVSSITVQTAQDAWYTLDGRKLDAEPTKKGIYIYKGKKVIK